MPSKDPVRTGANLLLAHLSPDDLVSLQPHLEPVQLPLRRQLESRNKPIQYVYFIESGFASVVANGRGDRSVEVGLVGREGMTGIPVLMGTDRSPHDTYMQLAGSGHRMSAASLRTKLAASATLRHVLLNWAHVFMIQTGQTALANGRGKLEERLARWLLMAHDRTEGETMRLTHEFLAVMLGVRRPGVTVALSLLAAQGLVRVNRGAISIVDRAGLEELTKGGYGAPEAEFRRLFG